MNRVAIVLTRLLPAPVVFTATGQRCDLVLTSLYPRPSVRAVPIGTPSLDLRPFLKGDKGDPGEPGAPGAPGRDASVPDVVAALAANHSITLRALDGSVIATVYGDTP